MAANGTFSYTHDGSETATDTFFYTLSDGVNNVTVTVTIQIDAVNDCPTVVVLSQILPWMKIQPIQL